MPKLCIANWKMKLDRPAALNLLAAIAPTLKDLPAQALWVAAPATLLQALAGTPSSPSLRIGAQNCHGDKEGAYTGEVSVAMLREVGASFSLVGHSERRHTFGEPESVVRQRLLGCLAQGLTTVLCIGETREQYDRNERTGVLTNQLEAVATLSGVQSENLIVAYEPVWAIGTGRTPTPAEIAECHATIKKQLPPKTPVLYGGSVTAETIAEILNVPLVDGVLVGGASTQAGSLTKILTECSRLSS